MNEVNLDIEFRILDYSISHQLLLLRNSINENDNDYNTDIVFMSVYYIEIPESMEGILLKEGSEEDYEYVRKKYLFELNYLNRVYTIETNGTKYYIGASSYTVRTNTLLPLESSIKH